MCVCVRVHVDVCACVYELVLSQSVGKDDSLRATDTRMMHAVVMRLVDPIKGRGHHVYVDNYYTSPQLFSDLHDNDFRACGTV